MTKPVKPNPLVKIENMTFSRGERVIYDNISLSIPTGKVTAIMGPSGIGKTTLLRLIGGQIRPEAGNIFFGDKNIPKLSRNELYETRKRMSMLFQSGALFTDMNVFDNIAFPIREHCDLPEALIEKIVLMKLEAVGLRGARHLQPSELSGGMARRAALARAIALDPELILYDEPFAGQDPISMGVIVRLIRSLNDALGLTSVVVSHDVPEVMSIADYIYIIADKKIIGEGTPEQIMQAPSPLVQQFVNGEADGAVPFHYDAPPYKDELIKSGSMRGHK
jgi:phospholipid/cholesterol/gamma-HCH transport system ATP-binding protein